MEQEERRWAVLLALLFSLHYIKRRPHRVDGCKLGFWQLGAEKLQIKTGWSVDTATWISTGPLCINSFYSAALTKIVPELTFHRLWSCDTWATVDTTRQWYVSSVNASLEDSLIHLVNEAKKSLSALEWRLKYAKDTSDFR